ncbi:MAG: anaerobic glycerol-3-phosphate dehydrogenase subunit GlpA, partial [Omnitrophica WOR_2 bacterium]
MRKIQTEVLVLGGGATGAGVARDLAMRGFKTILVEKGDLTHGTTGRYHGLLHGGGRYAVKDPPAARECIEENRILRRIMPHCIEDTGGFFVVTPWDDPDYAPQFLQGCQSAGIPVEEISIHQMLKEEPSLNPEIRRCFRVPDGAADSFLATDANAQSARQYGAQILTYHKVMKLLVSNGSGRVTGAVCHDLVKDEDVEISANMVVNALGAWAGQIAASIGIPIQIIPGKGTMLAFNYRFLNTVINRCKMPSDGDIIVPIHTVAVAGTTDVPVPDPDHIAIEPWEVELILSEGEKLVPGLRQMRILRAWAGVRPLYKETRVENTREITRAYVLLDHEHRDGITGLVTITSGKWTTYRKMAEVTVDLVCQKLGVRRECRTQDEPLPGSAHGYHSLGARLAEIERDNAYGDLVCECELATVQYVRKAIIENGAKTLDDIRRDIRLGMGPCQGGFCTYRVAGILQALRSLLVEETNAALRDFLQERWKGLLPVLWGQQLRQERLDELVYLDVLNAQALPGPEASPLAELNYAQPAITSDPVKKIEDSKDQPLIRDSPSSSIPDSTYPLDVVVIGSGLAGLTAGWRAAAGGKRVRVISKGYGALYWGSGCIDVLGYYPIDRPAPLDSPLQGLEQVIASHPKHPYALLGLDRLAEALSA